MPPPDPNRPYFIISATYYCLSITFPLLSLLYPDTKLTVIMKDIFDLCSLHAIDGNLILSAVGENHCMGICRRNIPQRNSDTPIFSQADILHMGAVKFHVDPIILAGYDMEPACHAICGDNMTFPILF